MDFSLPPELVDYLARLDAFIEAEIKPLQTQDDNERFFDHRREWARTDFEAGGLPRPEWEALLKEAKSSLGEAEWGEPDLEAYTQFCSAAEEARTTTS